MTKGSIVTGIVATAAVSSWLNLALIVMAVVGLEVVVLVVIIKVVCADDDRYTERLKGIIKEFWSDPRERI
jgi:hypothetical protein